MQRIPIALAESGMVLAKEVVHPENPSGPSLCGKGMKLTDSLLKRLRNMGVQSLIVQGHPVCMEGDKPLEVLLNELDNRFSRVADDALAGMVKNVYRDYLVRSMEE